MTIERLTYVFGFLVVVGTFVFFADSNQRIAERQTLGAKTSKPADPPSPLDGKKLVFSDEFNDAELNGRSWSTCYDWKKPTETGCTNSGNFEQQWYTEDQVKVQDGELVLTAKKNPVDVALQGQVKSFEYLSGMVNSGAGSTNSPVRWAGTYGYYEAKIKFDAGQGIWPAFWLLPVGREWPPEIDIMEFIGSKPDEILQTLHWDNNGQAAKSDEIIKGSPDYSADWHTYAVDWKPDGIDWYIDGKKTRSYGGSNVPSVPMEIILNLAVGGTLPGNANETTPAQREMRIDYVRVYQSPEQIRPFQR